MRVGCCEVDGEGVDRSFDECGGPLVGRPRGSGRVVELMSLLVEGGVGGVEILRGSRVGARVVTSTDESEDLSVVGDGQDEPVAESADQAAGAAADAQPDDGPIEADYEVVDDKEGK